jgi:hypothetical protein
LESMEVAVPTAGPSYAVSPFAFRPPKRRRYRDRATMSAPPSFSLGFCWHFKAPPRSLPCQRFNSELSGVLLPWGVFLGGIWQPPRYSAHPASHDEGFRRESGECRCSACRSPVSRRRLAYLAVKAITSGLRAKTWSILTEHTAGTRRLFLFGFQDLGQVPPPPISDLANYFNAGTQD